MNTKIDFFIHEQQDIFDLSVQTLGGVEYTFDLLRKIYSSIGFSKIDALEYLISDFYPIIETDGVIHKLVNTEKTGNDTVVSKLKSTNFVVNNSGSPAVLTLLSEDGNPLLNEDGSPLLS